MIGITAQVSLYPLRQESLSPAISEALETFRAHGLRVESGSMSSLIVGDDAAIFAALQEAFRRAAEQGQVVMAVTLSNACPVPGRRDDSITYRAIGHVENDFYEPDDSRKDTRCRIPDHPRPNSDGGLEGFEPRPTDHGCLLLPPFRRLRLVPASARRQKPTPRGVFALCSPRRPNPIGVTVVDLVAIEGNVLRVRGLDAINGTPVLDLKPA